MYFFLWRSTLYYHTIFSKVYFFETLMSYMAFNTLFSLALSEIFFCDVGSYLS